MSKKEKIGVGIITCNRLNYLKGLVDTLVPCKDVIDCLVVVNDGTDQPDWRLSYGEWVNNEQNLGVAKSKNKALKHLFDAQCDFFFLIEDDMLIKDPTVFEQYINAFRASGIQHFNYGPGSPFNRKQEIQNFDLHNRHLLNEKTEPNPKLIVDYKTCKIALYEHTVAMFSFFTRKLLEEGLGYMPEEYDRCWEHVDGTYQIIKAGYHPPFWWFADIANSHELIEEAPGAIENSSIAKNKDEWMQRVMEGREIYKRRHGHYPNQPPQHTKEEVIKMLKQIKTNGK
jgi:glycosyltransferase involved in cell wall biosynthesis